MHDIDVTLYHEIKPYRPI